MRLLVLSFYFPPDLSAGSFRTVALVSALRQHCPPNSTITVVTTLPNRYKTYHQDAAEHELDGPIEIVRIRLPTHRSDMLGQSRAFARFARRALAITSKKEYDIVFATSSRLMTAVLGTVIAKKKRAALYLDLRDIFADTIKDVLPPFLAHSVAWASSVAESWAVRSADRVNLVSRGFEAYFRARYRDQSFSWFTNGIDDEFLEQARDRQPGERDAGPITILYAGNIGESQALHKIVPELASRLVGRARFVAIGDGGRRDVLEKAVAGMANVEIRSPVPRAELLKAYGEADVLFLHLASRGAFEKVLPSKIFEYAALGKPLLAGVSGFPARFVREEIENSAVFDPEDADGAIQALDALELGDHPRADFIARYARSSISKAMAHDILELNRQVSGSVRCP